MSLSACTGQLSGTFRYKQQEESFSDQQKINTQIDLLWVIDNSSSMDVSQKALRDKVAGFARKYLKPYWDIRVGVITTDTYLANPVFSGYLNRTIPSSSTYKSYHLSQLISTRVQAGHTTGNDEKLAKLSSMGVTITNNNATAGIFSSGMKYQDLVPAWARGVDYARLLPGLHDGPVAGLCNEKLPYFIGDDNASYPLVVGPQCKIRDSADETGPSTCLSAVGADSVSQCVNTALNDTVRSGHAILSTTPDGTMGDEAWVNEIVNRFMLNISAGSSGHGSERGLGSVLEFLDVNEKSETAFFRKGSLRGIIFLTDEDDQTMTLPDVGAVPTDFTPDTNYVCDLPSLVAANTGKFANPSNYIQNQYRYCGLAGATVATALVSEGCPSHTVDGYTYSVGTCPKTDKLVTVASVKDKIDTFFKTLDGADNANYFVVAIVPTTAATIQSLQSARYQSDDRLDTLPFFNSGGSLVTQTRLRLPAVDKGWRYLELVDQVGSGSLGLDIGAADYSVLLDSIGTTIVQKKSVFKVKFSPSSKDDMVVKVLHADGTETIIRHDQYEFEGRNVTITDQPFVLSLKESDRITINYEPKNLKDVSE